MAAFTVFFNQLGEGLKPNEVSIISSSKQLIMGNTNGAAKDGIHFFTMFTVAIPTW